MAKANNVVVDFITAEEKCHTGEVQLVGGAPNLFRSDKNGRLTLAVQWRNGLLEVCADGHWGRVCDYIRKEWG